MKKERLAQLLTYAGTIPFLASAVIGWQSPDMWGLDYNQIILTYGAVIASFIAGIHWGVYLFREPRINLFIHSNFVALLAWFAVLTALPGSAGILMLCFLYLLFIDKQLSNVGFLEPWYIRMRIVATLIVTLALSINILL